MTTKKNAPAETPDEHEGMGGSYVVNPDTGKRDLVERTKPADEVTDSEAQNGTV